MRFQWATLLNAEEVTILIFTTEPQSSQRFRRDPFLDIRELDERRNTISRVIKYIISKKIIMNEE